MLEHVNIKKSKIQTSKRANHYNEKREGIRILIIPCCKTNMGIRSFIIID
jgi:hypothetical protein